MDLSELDAYRSLARHLHFGRAASSLALSASALSRLVARLEADAGTALVDRSARKVALTEAGLRYLAFAEETLGRREALASDLHGLSGDFRGTFRVYASVTACYSILPPFVSALRERHPRIRLAIETGDPAEAIDVLRQKRVDLALAALPFGGVPDFDGFRVERTPLVFVQNRMFAEIAATGGREPAISKGNRMFGEIAATGGRESAISMGNRMFGEIAATGGRESAIFERDRNSAASDAEGAGKARSRGAKATVARAESRSAKDPMREASVDLVGLVESHPLILPAKGLARERFDRWAAKNRVRVNVAAETSGNEAVLALARLGLGLGLVPRLVLENSPFAAGLSLIPAGPAFGDYDIGFLAPRLRRPAPGSLHAAVRSVLEAAWPKGRWLAPGEVDPPAEDLDRRARARS